MDINTATGEKVVFVGDAGWDGDVMHALKFLEHDQEYTVESLSVGQSSSTVLLREIPNQRFNTVMFKNNALAWKRFDWFREQCYIGFGKPTTQEEFAVMPFKDAHIYKQLLLDRDGTISEAQPERALIVNHDDDFTIKNSLSTARRDSHQQLCVLNPIDRQEVVELFVKRFKCEPYTINTVHFNKHFDPCDCFGDLAK
jgi:hypothetical protein